jgi:hypothetical protein
MNERREQRLVQTFIAQPTKEGFRKGVLLRLQIAFDERCRIHDLMIEGIGLALKKRGYSTNR